MLPSSIVLGVLLVFCSLLCPFAVSQEAEVTFEMIDLGMPAGNFAAVAMGDIDGDGFGEILSGRRDGQEGLFLFDYNDAGWSHQQITRDGEYGGVALADITGDGLLDLLAVRTQGRPSGLQTFQTSLEAGSMRFQLLPSLWTETGCDDLAVGDIDQDGDTDIAVSTGGRGVQVFLNQGRADSFLSLSLETETYEDTGVALGDVNGDGFLDVIATNHPGEPPHLFLWRGTTDAGYGSGHTEGLPSGTGIGYGIGIADLNSDEAPELVIGTASGIHLLLGNDCVGPDTDWWRKSTVPYPGENCMQVSLGDLDNDGLLDIVVASNSGIQVLMNSSSQGFRLLPGVPVTEACSGCFLLDWEGDGDLDIAYSSLQGFGVGLLRNTSVPEE